MRLQYFLGETVQNLRRNFLMTIAAVSTVAISLLLLGGVQILGIVINNVAGNTEEKLGISVYLRDDIAPGELSALRDTIGGYPEVAEYEYITKDDAFEEFRRRYAGQPEFTESLPRDALPASLRIRLIDPGLTEEVASRIQGAPGVDDVRFGGEIVRRLLQVNSLLRTITFGMSLMLMIAAAALIANAIRLGIYARRDEIGIMKLVGATNWFIRIPFILEGIFAALAGAVIAGAIVLGGNALLFSRIGDAIPFMRPILTFTGGEIAGVLLLLAAVAAVVGLVGSSLALRRFLEV
jgi:cell division transport system permease protein